MLRQWCRRHFGTMICSTRNRCWESDVQDVESGIQDVETVMYKMLRVVYKMLRQYRTRYRESTRLTECFHPPQFSKWCGCLWCWLLCWPSISSLFGSSPRSSFPQSLKSQELLPWAEHLMWAVLVIFLFFVVDDGCSSDSVDGYHYL